jgi:hypothetical protein
LQGVFLLGSRNKKPENLIPLKDSILSLNEKQGKRKNTVYKE